MKNFTKGLNIKHLHLTKTIKKSHIDKQIGNSVKNIAKTTERGVGTVYKDVKGELGKVGGFLSNPLLLIGVAVVGVFILSNSSRR